MPAPTYPPPPSTCGSTPHPMPPGRLIHQHMLIHRQPLPRLASPPATAAPNPWFPRAHRSLPHAWDPSLHSAPRAPQPYFPQSGAAASAGPFTFASVSRTLPSPLHNPTAGPTLLSFAQVRLTPPRLPCSPYRTLSLRILLLQLLRATRGHLWATPHSSSYPAHSARCARSDGWPSCSTTWR